MFALKIVHDEPSNIKKLHRKTTNQLKTLEIAEGKSNKLKHNPNSRITITYEDGNRSFQSNTQAYLSNACVFSQDWNSLQLSPLAPRLCL